MKLDRTEMLNFVRHQLALDMNCEPQDFMADGILFCEAQLNTGRRMFERQTPYLEIATMGKGIVVSGDKHVIPKIKPLIENKARDDVFCAPFVYGHSLYYLPDSNLQESPCPDQYTYCVKEGNEIHALYEIPGFNNAIQYDKDHSRPDGLAIYAMNGDQIVAMAGASIDSQTMWQIGIDVLPPFRHGGLASYLVSKLAVMILDRGIVPYYGTASSNIPSQAVAYRSGFTPAWMCTYQNTLNGISPYTADGN